MNENIPFIRSESIVKKYEVSFLQDTISFQIKIRKEHIDFLNSNQRIGESFRSTQESFRLRSWLFGSKKYLGFNNCFHLISTREGWMTFVAPITSGRALAIVLTLVELLPIINHLICSRRCIDDEVEQDMILITTCSETSQFYGAAMYADLSIKFSLWLYNQDEDLRTQVNPSIYKAMCAVYKKIWKSKPQDETGGLMEKGFLLFPPAGIYTCQFGILRQDQVDFDNHRGAGHMGYETFCHNLDHWKQQIVLLAGFFVICESFRKSQE